MRQPGLARGSRLAARGSRFGVRGTLLAGAVGQLLPVSLSPPRRMRELPSYVESTGERDTAAGLLVPRGL
ncbi:hypothetical protein [Streptomyces sp. NPDC055140]